MLKKGASVISILILVFMVLVLFSTVLITYFLNSQKVDKEILNSRTIEKAYFIENKINLYLSQGLSLQKAVELAGNSELIGGKPGWVRIRVKSKDDKVETQYEFQARVISP